MDEPLNDADARSLVAHLGSLDDELSSRERRLLRAVLVAALDPLDHRQYFGTGFTDDQLAVLERIEAERGVAELVVPGSEG